MLLCDSIKHTEDASEMQDESEGQCSQSEHWGLTQEGGHHGNGLQGSYSGLHAGAAQLRLRVCERQH